MLRQTALLDCLKIKASFTFRTQTPDPMVTGITYRDYIWFVKAGRIQSSENCREKEIKSSFSLAYIRDGGMRYFT